jgi:hypothetical protein
MAKQQTTDPEIQLDRSGQELEERIERLDDHIDAARQKAVARKEEADPDADVDWDEDVEDDDGDPAAFDDPEQDEEDEDE